MRYEVKPTGKFRKDYKRMVKRGLKIELLVLIVICLNRLTGLVLS
jgi:mRNA-degrading endonuclease YafQ of YafQ-DinJ toxin-antitoxin module